MKDRKFDADMILSLNDPQHNERAVKQTSLTVERWVGKFRQKYNIIISGNSREKYPIKGFRMLDWL